VYGGIARRMALKLLNISTPSYVLTFLSLAGISFAFQRMWQAHESAYQGSMPVGLRCSPHAPVRGRARSFGPTSNE
jgi:hypothetical protein